MSLLIPLLSQLASSPLGEVGRGLLFIHWNPDIFAFSIGSFGIRWYSLCWCIGLLSVFLLEQRLFKEQ